MEIEEKYIKTIYHGTDHILPKPKFGVRKEDNDYGSGFYTTEDRKKADEWAAVNGTDVAITNKYEISLYKMRIVDLDKYGTLSWIAEIIAHRGARGEASKILGDKIVEKYKLNLDDADVIIGYRADDSYIDIVDAFLLNKLSIEEVDRLFRKGNLGKQVFIKSETAFSKIIFKGHFEVENTIENKSEIQARMDVAKFLKQRDNNILLNGYTPVGILARDVVNNNYKYNQEYQYYELTDEPINKEIDYEEYE